MVSGTTGYTYVWDSSTSGVTGSFTVIPGATNSTYTTTKTGGSKVYYTGIYYCLSGGCGRGQVIVLNDGVVPPITSSTGSFVANLCISGPTMTLSDATSGGRWISSATTVATVGSSTGVITPVSVGTATITYDMGGSCFSTETVTVVTGISPIAGVNNVCVGLSTILNDATPAGVWSSGNSAVATIGSSTGIVTGISTGTSVITYSLGGACIELDTFTVFSIGSIGGSKSVCRGQTSWLINANPGGKWTTANSTIATIDSSTGVVTGVATGTASISYSLGPGCTTTDVVTVYPLPSMIAGPSNVCVGSATIFSDATTGGGWLSSAPSVAAIGSLTGLVLALSPGTASIVYTVPTGCTATFSLTVNPTAIIGIAKSICIGVPTGLSSSIAGGAWSTSSSSIASVGSVTGIINGIASGTTTITYVLPTGCLSVTTVNVTPSPTAISGGTSVCAGSLILLSSFPSGGSWTTGSTSIAGVGSLSGIVTGISPGTSMINYTLGTGCSVSTIITVLLAPGPISGLSPACTGSSNLLSDAIAGGSWASSNTTVAIVGSSSGIVSWLAPGTATIAYMLGTGCMSFTTTTIYPAPSPIVGASILCVGNTAPLSNSISGGLWSSGNTAIAGVGSVSGIMIGNTIGTAMITYSISGCVSTTLITVHPLPPIMGSSSVCTGDSIALSIISAGGSWSSSNTTIAAVNSLSGLVTGINAGTTTISYLTTTGCLSSMIVTVNPTPPAISGNLSLCTFMTNTLSNTLLGGFWTSGMPSVAGIGGSTGLAVGVAPGTSTITYALSSGCQVTTVLTVSPASAPITGSNRVCAGSAITLTNATPGGIWTSSNTAIATAGPSTGIVTGIAAGTSVVSYALPTRCAATVIVSVNSLPGAISGIAALCTGGTSSLSSGPGGGFWTSSNTSVATVSSVGKVSGINPGTSSVMYKIASTGCSSIVTVTVAIAPATIGGVASVCTGSTTILTDAVAGGSWTSSNTAIALVGVTSGIVTGINKGTAVITYSLGAGCIADTVVSVQPAPAISGASNICIGQATLLSNSVAGGAWGSSNTGVATISGPGLVTGIATGTSTISYLLPSGCATTTVMTVNAAPPGILGVTAICPGQTITLSDATVGGTWTSSNTAIATIGAGTGIATGIVTGSTTITYILGAGCVVTGVLIVRALPAAISGPSNVCAGSTVVLSDATTGGTWSSMGSVVAVSPTTGIVTGIIAGTEIVTYTAGTGCTTSKIINVDPVPSAISGPGDVCVGKSVTLSDATTGGTWSTSTGAVTIGTTTGIVTGVSAGTSNITYTSAAGCTETTTFTVNALPATITGPGAVCQGSTITLNDITPGGIWTSSSTGVATIDIGAGLITGIAGGLANITYTAAAGCVATKLVMVYSVSPVTGGRVVCVGKTTALSNAISGGTWSSSSAVVNVGSSSGIVTGVSSGTATVIYLLPSGCTSSAVITVNPLPSAGVISGASLVCATTAIFLSDAVTGGVWSTGSTTVSVTPGTGVVTGLSAGPALINYDVTNSCGVATATHTMVVAPLPLAAAITGTDSVCAGASVTLSNASAGGVWSTVATTLSVGSVSGIVTGISKGTATITYAYTNICGTDIATRRMKVNPLPQAGIITGPTNVCVAATITLSDTIAGGMWVKTNANASLAGNVVTGVTAGKDTIIYTNTNMCGSKATLTVITIDPLPDAGTIKGADHVCAGLTTTLTDTATGGMWSSSNITVAGIATTGVVTGLSAGGAVITYVVTNVCGTDFKVLSFTVHSQPYAGIIYGADQVCVDKTVTVTDSIAGGVWSGQYINIASVADTIVTGLAAGIDTVLYSYTNICGTAVAKHGIIVNPLPNAGFIAGEKEACIGSALLLTNDTTGGVWSTTSTTISVADGHVTGMAAGTAIVDYAVTNMCGTATTDKIITIMPFPVVTEIFGAASVCEGATIALTDATIGGLWDSKHDLVQVVNGAVTGVTAGVDTVRYNVVNLCGVATARKEITVYPRPDAGVIQGADSVCAGDTIMLYNNATGGTWNMNSNAHTTLLRPSSIIGNSEGADTVVYTVTNSCGQAMAVFAVGVRSEQECQPYGADTIKHPFDCAGNGELVIYPNPNTGVFTLNIISDMQEHMNVKIVNMLGQKVLQFPYTTNDPIELKLNLPRGTYIISVYNAHGHCAKKLTIE